MAVRLSQQQFERVVEDALAELPERFSRMVHNVMISIEEEPTEEDLGVLDGEDGDEDDELLGIYRGVALTERGIGEQLLPDEIVIFRGPISRACETREEAVHEVRETVLHELGHYFGLGDGDMPH